MEIPHGIYWRDLMPSIVCPWCEKTTYTRYVPLNRINRKRHTTIKCSQCKKIIPASGGGLIKRGDGCYECRSGKTNRMVLETGKGNEGKV